jgi:hypothetical protein
MPIDILLVEDNKGDIRLMREVLGEINPTARRPWIFCDIKDAISLRLARASFC